MDCCSDGEIWQCMAAASKAEAEADADAALGSFDGGLQRHGGGSRATEIAVMPMVAACGVPANNTGNGGGVGGRGGGCTSDNNGDDFAGG
jgi:hypothetical protein